MSDLVSDYVDHAFEREPGPTRYTPEEMAVHRAEYAAAQESIEQHFYDEGITMSPRIAKIHTARRGPRLIALCGNPHAGKSEVQKLLEDAGYNPVDDAWPVRDFAMRHFGLTKDDVTTQAGKDRYTEVNGVMIQNRAILGLSANSLEQQFGDHILPWMALRGLDGHKAYSFGSVRRDQAKTYTAAGGCVIGVRRPGVGPTGNEFDRFDESLVDVWIDNDGTLKHLAVKVTYALQALRLAAKT